MNLIPEKFSKYCELHTSAESSLLHDLYRETHQKVINPVMLSGQVQGIFLKMITWMIQAKNILEIGTYTGYSGICLADGLAEGGCLYSIDNNPETFYMAKKYFEKAGLKDKVKQIQGHAIEVIPSLDGPFDLVFIDADKSNYCNYYDLVFEKVVKNGFILVDNVWWSGKVLDENIMDEDTEGIRHFNKMVKEDDRVENILFPIRDGLMLIRKLID